jgi:hypothetical protein
MQWNGIEQNQHRAYEDTATPQASDSSPDDKHQAALRCATHGTPSFEEENAGQKHGLSGEEGIYPSLEQDESGRREHVRTPVPANVGYTAEMVGDCWDRGPDDGSVECYEENGDVERYHDDGCLGC